MGYSQSFVQNFSNIAEILSQNPKNKIKVTYRLDDICKPCPNHEGSLCQSEKKINELDKRHSFILGLYESQIVTWEEAKERIAQRMTLDKFKEACLGCPWQKFGVCEEALHKNLHEYSRKLKNKKDST